MSSKILPVREYPMELIHYFARRPWDDVSVQEAFLRDKSGLVQRAHDCSGGMHDNTFRRDGKPVKTHPEKVVKILIYYGIDDPVILAAGYLHDAPEDVDEKILEEIEAGYPEKVYSIVCRVTKRDGMSLEEHFCLIDADFDSILVKLADRLHNLRNMAKNIYLTKKFTKNRLRKYEAETIKNIYPLGEKIAQSDYKYVKEGENIYLALKEAVRMAEMVLRLPQKVIENYQKKRKKVLPDI